MRILTTVLLYILASFQAFGFKDEFIRKENLSALNNATVYSIAQDSTQALWISCSVGLMRYNGNSIRKVYDVLPMQQVSYDGGSLIWALSHEGLLRIDVMSLEVKRIESHFSEINFERSKVCSNTASVLLCSGRDIYTVNADSLSHLLTLPSASDIDYIGADRQKKFYVASGKMLWRISENIAYPVTSLPYSGVSSVYFDSRDQFWVGYMHEGIAQYDNYFNLVSSYPIQARNVRTFSEDPAGNIWAGSATSLHCISPDGTYKSAEEPSPMAQPITSLLCDTNGNLWAGTFYSGVYMSVGIEFPFDNLAIPAIFRNARSACLLEEGKVAVLTDGNGAWIYDKDRLFRKIPGTDGYKFISSCPIEGENVIYAGLYRGGIVMISEQAIMPVSLKSKEGTLNDVSANALLLHNGKLYVAADDGLYTFESTGKRTELTGVLKEGINDQLLSLGRDTEDHIWASGRGLYMLDQDDNPQKISNGFFPTISCSASGVWASEFGKGVCRIYPSGIIRYDDRSAGILDNTISFIYPISDGRLLLGTRTGLSIFDSIMRQSLNYSDRNGLQISSTHSSCATDMGDGQCLVLGADGAAMLRVKDIPKVKKLPSLKLDIIEFAGTEEIQRPMPNGKSTRLRHNQNSLILEFANFEYSGVFPQSYEYSIKSHSNEWIPFNPSAPLSMIGMKPGKYALRTRPTGSPESTYSFSFRILRPWYLSIVACFLYAILIAGVITYIFYILNGRLLLKQKLKDKEAENEERTRLFIKLSHELRTPLTSVIGQLSLYFKGTAPRFREIRCCGNLIKELWK